uniref:Uncharacterized protein n=1 Tax=Cacopsylla melanoneura TaxID=428564 RepID=A0A8D8R2Q6_9HEMI
MSRFIKNERKIYWVLLWLRVNFLWYKVYTLTAYSNRSYRTIYIIYLTQNKLKYKIVLGILRLSKNSKLHFHIHTYKLNIQINKQNVNHFCSTLFKTTDVILVSPIGRV